ncbi:hypothetical protein MKLM6_2362 [Methylomonas koyamae]|uniref:Uncharacterized protein n=1 Tax=Methylomonas koyamae TaxID=702114 RepID=A0A291IJK8_9GAMM|nr:hypothetical protein AYM39_11425 [Methylomonas sp. DH-1]ATG90585.1 hypothetical protein MKLM6_2362 [Methylomonas koyamae]OAI28344.1 hypothetical protein A1356_07150 [Methylomonas koyamae]
MKELVNLNIKSQFTLPDGTIVSARESMPILNESIFETLEFKRLLKGPNPKIKLETLETK